MTMTPTKLLVLLVVWVIGILVSLELVLQVASLAAALIAPEGSRPPRRIRDNRRVVLCVGDSFTFGTGASSPAMAYPSQLREVLREMDPHHPALEWEVINHGWPGRNSSELLQRLPELLREYRPNYVVILVGVNNLWNTTEMDQSNPDFEGDLTGPPQANWRWRWRTRRLLRVAFVRLREPGMSASTSRTKRPGPARLQSRSKTPTTPQARKLAPELAAVVRRARGAYRNSDFERSVELIESVRPTLRDSGGLTGVERLVSVLRLQRRYADAVQEGLAGVRKYGKSARLARTLVKPLRSLGHRAQALEWAEAAVELAPEDPRGYEQLALAHIDLGHGFEAIRGATEAFARHRNEDRCADLYGRLFWHGFAGDRDRFTSEFDRLAVAGDLLSHAKRIFHARVGSAGLEKLREDLGLMTKAIGHTGAQLVLMTYPHPDAPRVVQQVIRDVGERHRVPVVDNSVVFSTLRSTVPDSYLFLPDGHCTDRGYSVISEQVAITIDRLERASSG